MTSPARMYSLQRRTASRSGFGERAIQAHGFAFSLRKSTRRQGPARRERRCSSLDLALRMASGCADPRTPRGRACRARCPSPRARRRRAAACRACRADPVFLLQRVLLDMADRLVAEVAGEAAAEAQRRRAGATRWRPSQARAYSNGRPRRFPRQTSAPRVAQQAPNCAAARRDPCLRSAQARPMNEAPEALAADHRLEEVRVGVGELQVHRERRVQIRAPRRRPELDCIGQRFTAARLCRMSRMVAA